MRRAPWATVLAVAAASACGIDATVLRELPIDGDAATDASSEASSADATLDGGSSGFDAGLSNGTGAVAGQAFSCTLTRGMGACWGMNSGGELGTGDDEDRLAPKVVTTTMRFAALALGASHTCGLRAPDGTVFCWGANANGQLGVGDTAPRATPASVALQAPAAQLTAGYQHTCAVLVDGSLWCWGDDAEGQLGLDDPTGSPDALVPRRVGSANDWTLVSGGQGHTCGVRAPGTMWCWGRNTSYELGLGTLQVIQIRAPAQVGTWNDWTFVELGQDGACGLRADHSLWCWGDGTWGQLASPPSRLPTPTQVGTDTDWNTVQTDTFSTCALKSSGALYCWGRNVEGQLGTGDNEDRTSPTLADTDAAFGWVAVGRFHSCAETTALSVLCTGANESGELGLGDTNRRNVFTAVMLPASP